VHIVFDGQGPAVGYLQEGVEGSDMLIGECRGQEDLALGRVDEAGRAEADEESLIVCEFGEEALGNGHGVGRCGNGTGMKASDQLAAQIQPARLDMSRSDGGSDNVEPACIDGKGYSRSSGPAGLGSVFSQEPSIEEVGHEGANRIWPQLRPLMQLPPADRPFFAENSKNSALIRRQDWLFITEHDRK
jgi:hypothetical protein